MHVLNFKPRMSTLFYTQASREVDNFMRDVSATTPPNKNVEVGGRDGFKTFPHGVSNWIRNERRINGGWHVAIARHLHVYLSTSPLLPRATRAKIGEAYSLLLEVHSSLRYAVQKTDLPRYQGVINDLLKAMVDMNTKYTPSDCNSIKYHWPLHWSDTRRELGCSAAEKSLERKLGEVQKRNFKYTNGRFDVEVRRCTTLHSRHTAAVTFLLCYFACYHLLTLMFIHVANYNCKVTLMHIIFKKYP